MVASLSAQQGSRGIDVSRSLHEVSLEGKSIPRALMAIPYRCKKMTQDLLSKSQVELILELGSSGLGTPKQEKEIIY